MPNQNPLISLTPSRRRRPRTRIFVSICLSCQPRRLFLATRLFVCSPIQRLMFHAAVHHGATARASRILLDRPLRLGAGGEGAVAQPVLRDVGALPGFKVGNGLLRCGDPVCSAPRARSTLLTACDLHLRSTAAQNVGSYLCGFMSSSMIATRRTSPAILSAGMPDVRGMTSSPRSTNDSTLLFCAGGTNGSGNKSRPRDIADMRVSNPLEDAIARSTAGEGIIKFWAFFAATCS